MSRLYEGRENRKIIKSLSHYFDFQFYEVVSSRLGKA